MIQVDENQFINDDPLYGATLPLQPPIYVTTDVEKTPSDIPNPEFEDRYFVRIVFIHGDIIEYLIVLLAHCLEIVFTLLVLYK